MFDLTPLLDKFLAASPEMAMAVVCGLALLLAILAVRLAARSTERKK